DCARVLRIDVRELESWEFGDSVPSLPQLELLANYLDVPVSHFWGTEILSSEETRRSDIQKEYLALRDRMIGALLRQAREDASLSIDDLSATSHVPAARITQYELGELPMPVHELSVLANG